MILRHAVLLGVVLATSPVTAARLAPPPIVELDGCVMPAPACPSPRDMLTMRLRDREIEFAVERLALPTGGGSTGKVLTELKLRGVTVHGPAEFTDRLVKGAHLRLRAVLRPGPILMLQSAAPRPDR